MRRLIYLTLLACVAAWGVWAKTPPAHPVNLNTATVTELMQLPGIGPAKAEAILARRAQRPFARKEELMLIKGIGDKNYARMAPHVQVQPASATAMAASAKP